MSQGPKMSDAGSGAALATLSLKQFWLLLPECPPSPGRVPTPDPFPAHSGLQMSNSEVTLSGQMAGARQEKRPHPTRPPAPESRESEWTQRDDPRQGPPGRAACSGARAGRGGGPTSKAGGGAGTSAAPAAAAGPPSARPGSAPARSAASPRPAAGRRGRARDLEPGDSAGGRQGANYCSAGPGFKKFLLFPWKFRRRSPEGRHNSHLGEKTGILGRAVRRNRAQGGPGSPVIPGELGSRKAGSLPSLPGRVPQRFNLEMNLA